MAHECEDCGQTFETLTRRRLYDCPDATGRTTKTTLSGATGSNSAAKSVAASGIGWRRVRSAKR